MHARAAQEIAYALDRQAALSSALTSVFRGKFCDLVLASRKTTPFGKDSVIYTVGDTERNFFFLKSGFVKVGTIAADGREVIYDIRTGGDVVGELCAAEGARPDRAVTLEETAAYCVPLEEIVAIVSQKPEAVALLINLFGEALKSAFEQVNSLALDDTIRRTIKVLLGLASKFGAHSGAMVEIPIYITQEEIAQMVAARRERVSTALNYLRRQGLAQYSTRGHLTLDVNALSAQVA